MHKQPDLLQFYSCSAFPHAPVVVLDDVAYRPDSRQVLVDPLGADVVQRLRGPGVSVGPREVDGHLVKGRERQQARNPRLRNDQSKEEQGSWGLTVKLIWQPPMM